MDQQNPAVVRRSLFQIMMDNIKRTFELKEEAKEGFQPEKPSEQMTLDSGIKNDNTPSKEWIHGPEFLGSQDRTVSESLIKDRKGACNEGHKQ